VDGLAGDRRDLELDRPASLLLLDDGATCDLIAVRDVAHLQCHDIASSQLAVHAQIEQRQLARSLMLLQLKVLRPDVL
jgi:hypothetical protein